MISETLKLHEVVVPKNKFAVDVKISRFPHFLLGNVFSENTTGNKVFLMIYRWDRYSHLGWDKYFDLTLEFPENDIYPIKVPPSYCLADGHTLEIPLRENATTIVRPKPQDQNRIIPRFLWNLSAPMHKQANEERRNILKNNRAINICMQTPSFQYFVLEDDACEQELAENSIVEFPNLIEAFRSLRAGAFKADLVRYWLLYKYGGVYIDDKSVLRYSLDSDFFNNILSGDLSSCAYINSCPEIAFLAAKPKSPLILKLLNSAVENVIRRDYSGGLFGITGNNVFSKTLGKIKRETWIVKDDEKIYLLKLSNGEHILTKEGDLVWQRLTVPLTDQVTSSTYYSKLFSERKVFVDGNPEAPRFNKYSSLIQRSIFIMGIVFLLLLVMLGINYYPPIQWI